MKHENENNRDSYTFAPLDNYGLRERILIRLADYVIYFSILIIGRTLRFEPMAGWDDFGVGSWEEILANDEKENPAILVFWHDRVFLSTYRFRHARGHVVISKSFDGEYISRTAQRFGYGVVRGSSNKRSSASALAQLLSLGNRKALIGITVDGPRGPRHKSKKGAIIIASKSGIPVVPVIIEAKRRWIINTWDQTIIPKPFSRARVFWGERLFVPADADDKTIEEKRAELDRKLDELVSIAKEWRVATSK